MIVKQRYNSDCYLACLAMAASKPYEELFSKEFCNKIEEAKICSGSNLEEAILLAGFIKDETISSIYISWGNAPGLIKNLLWGRKAILQVPSLNKKGGSHAIFWTGSEIIDPSNKQTYFWLETVILEYVWIFNNQ